MVFVPGLAPLVRAAFRLTGLSLALSLLALLIRYEDAPIHREGLFALPPVTGPRATEPSGGSR